MFYLLALLLFIGLVYVLFPSAEGYYSDYQVMSRLPFITPPMGNHFPMLGWKERAILKCKYPDQPVARVGKYKPPPGARVYETGTAYDPNVYSSFGVVTPDDIWRF